MFPLFINRSAEIDVGGGWGWIVWIIVMSPPNQESHFLYRKSFEDD